MESIFAYALLWKCSFIMQEVYSSILDKAFIADPDSSLLLTLEERSTDSGKTYEIIFNLLHNNISWPDIDKVGNEIRSYIGKIYRSNMLPIEVFGQRCYELWNILPEALRPKEPFCVLYYADDYISFENAKRAKQIYDKAFCML